MYVPKTWELLQSSILEALETDGRFLEKTSHIFFQAGIKLFLINVFSVTGKGGPWASPTVDPQQTFLSWPWPAHFYKSVQGLAEARAR